MPKDDYKPPTGFVPKEIAARMLKVSPATVTRLVKRGKLHIYQDELDQRVKLFSTEEVEKLSSSGPTPVDPTLGS